MEEGEDLTLGEDWTASLITEVSSYMSPMINSPIHSKFFSFGLTQFIILFSGFAEDFPCQSY